MTKNHNNAVGDSKAPSLRPEECGLRTASDQAALISADTSAPASKVSGLGSVVAAIATTSSIDKVPTCKQTLWFSFFFDGTGNNLEADKELFKLSNIAKLFRAHGANDMVTGTYAFYMPGVGTYFPAIGDNGGSKLGLGTGSMGEERLQYALQKFDSYLAPHLRRAQASPSAAIVEVNVALFGFSRGAALARAFLNLVMNERCFKKEDKWALNSGKWPVRFRFMGLFDTVASVGMPMSANTTSTVGAAISSVKYMIKDRLQTYSGTRPQSLAFAELAKPGADPAPGKYDGHAGWGGRLNIDQSVEEVRHFIAAHETRNSFPVDSISTLRSGVITKPEHFYETVYPGVHSDVGGSYAPGEGARSDSPNENLGLIPLFHMYQYGIAKGVPFLPTTAWTNGNKSDFGTSRTLIDLYNAYLKKIGAHATLGEIINKHRGLYFSWRFRAIKIKAAGNRAEASRISERGDGFAKEAKRIDTEISVLEKEEAAAAAALNAVISLQAVQTRKLSEVPAVKADSAELDKNIKIAQERRKKARDDVLKAKARKLAHPNMADLSEMLEIYDAQLLADVRAIRKVIQNNGLLGNNVGKKLKELRPHYKFLVEAYENEFENDKGLKDETIINFFDNYVHDSLAAFAGDATLPSDPRVVYLGGDEKYQFAFHISEDAMEAKIQSTG